MTNARIGKSESSPPLVPRGRARVGVIWKAGAKPQAAAPTPTLPRSTRGGSKRGFTLIEVLTTMVVMAIVLPIAMRGISLTLQAAEMAKRSAIAATLADGKLNELSSSTGLTNAGTNSGDFSPDYPEYQWQATTTSISLGLEQIDVQVTWHGRDGERKLTVSTVIYPQGGTSS